MTEILQQNRTWQCDFLLLLSVPFCQHQATTTTAIIFPLPATPMMKLKNISGEDFDLF